jgi:hypothetical protein
VTSDMSLMSEDLAMISRISSLSSPCKSSYTSSWVLRSWLSSCLSSLIMALMPNSWNSVRKAIRKSSSEGSLIRRLMSDMYLIYKEENSAPVLSFYSLPPPVHLLFSFYSLPPSCSSRSIHSPSIHLLLYLQLNGWRTLQTS